MQSLHWRALTRSSGCCCNIPTGAFLALATLGLLSGLVVAAPSEEGYAPVAPIGAVHAAVRDGLKVVQDWLDEKDFASAAQAALGLKALCRLYVYQRGDPGWRERAAALADTAARLAAAARDKDPAACARLVRDAERLLDELDKGPTGARTIEKDFKPDGTTKTWMLLLEGSYSDAKATKDAHQLAQIAYAVAEEANAAQFLRSDARWRQSFRDVRAAALDVADKAKGKELAAASSALKIVRQRCDVCHQAYKR
jgi:hypothetical protein